MSKRKLLHKVSDNGGATVDRYTLWVKVSDRCWWAWGANHQPFHPQGFGQYCGQYDGGVRKPSLPDGDKLISMDDLPKQTRDYFEDMASQFWHN